MEKLFPEFPPVSTEEWLEAIKKDLKGASFEKLIRKTIDGLKFQPFYRKENTENLPSTENLPAEYPFLRGNKLTNDWKIRLNIYFSTPEQTIEKIKHLTKNGVEEIGIDFKQEINTSDEDLYKILDAIDLDRVSISFMAHKNIEKAFFALIDYFDERPENVNLLKGSLNFDPFTQAAFTGTTKNLGQGKITIITLLKNNTFENYRPLAVNVYHFANAGASPVQQLAIALAIAEEYFTFATNNGFSAEKITKNLIFNFAVGSEFLLEIAKLSAFRHLFAKFVSAYDKYTQAKAYIHTITTRRNKTIYDPYMNMIRTTIEGMAAVLAGSDVVTIEPFDIIFAEPDEFSERIAKNQQLIFKHEAYFDKVVDPWGGSYYVENLRTTLIQEAWKLFLQIQQKGGFINSLKNGFIQQIVSETANKEKQLVDYGKLALIGTNKYPNRTEKIKGKKILTPPEIKPSENPEFTPLKTSRLAEDFENLRLKTEQAGKTPKVFLFTYGKVAFRRARADFSGNFFAVAGFEIIDNPGFETIEDGLKEWQKHNPEITVLCSEDEKYLEMAQKIYPALKDKTILVVAGNPENRQDIENTGIKHFIHVKSNILEELKKFQKLTNIA